MSLLNCLNKSLGQLAQRTVLRVATDSVVATGSLESSSRSCPAATAAPRCCLGFGNNARLQVARNYGILARQQLVLTPSSKSMAKQVVRTVCGRENCADPCDWPPCAERNLAKKPECQLKRTSNRMNIYEAYWAKQNDECCLDPCRWSYPKFDDLYYMDGDKENRIYTQTWVECPELRIVPKKVCCYEQGIPPVFCKRQRKERPKTACKQEVKCQIIEGACPRIKMPCCCDARIPPKCHKGRVPVECKKFCAPYPSFSECNRDRLRKGRPVECFCLRPISLCEYYAWLRTQKTSTRGHDSCY